MHPPRPRLAPLLALAAAVFCLALLARTGQAAAGCLDRFLVRPGDTLTGIADIYGFDWRVLARLNNLEAPYDLQAGRWLCLPAVVGAEAAAATPHPSRLPAFTANISGGQVRVQTRNFPVKNSYLVRITADPHKPRSTWTRLGILRTKTGGNVEARFSLPARFKGVSPLRLCLKNMTTDQLTCITVLNPR